MITGLLCRSGSLLTEHSSLLPACVPPGPPQPHLCTQQNKHKLGASRPFWIIKWKQLSKARLSLQNGCFKVRNSLERKRAQQNVPLGIQKLVFPSVNCAPSVTEKMILSVLRWLMKMPVLRHSLEVSLNVHSWWMVPTDWCVLRLHLKRGVGAPPWTRVQLHSYLQQVRASWYILDRSLTQLAGRRGVCEHEIMHPWLGYL